MKKVLSVLVVLFVSFQLNAQWVSQVSPVTNQDFVGVSAVDNDVCWIAGFGSAVVRTTNGGTNWSNVSLPPIGNVIADISSIYAIDANTCLVSLYTPNTTYVYKTTNGGSSWGQVFAQVIPTNTSFNGIRAIYMTSAANGFMAGDPVNLRWSLWKTTDGGSTWDSTGLYLKAENSTDAGAFHCLYVDGTKIWFGTGSSKIYYSSNYGQTWSSQNTQTLTSVYDVWFNGTTGIAAGTAGTNFDGPGALYLSTNSGTTWIPAPYPGGINITAAAGKGSNFIYSTLHGAIYLSTNNGASFSKVDSVTVAGHVYYDIRMSRSGNSAWACGPNGMIRKGTTTHTAINDMKPVVQNFSLEQNYPNPFNPSTTIKYAVLFESNVNIRFYNSLGQIVREVNESNRQPGNYEINFNSSGLASGIYFYSIKALSSDGKNNYTAVKKMILLK